VYFGFWHCTVLHLVNRKALRQNEEKKMKKMKKSLYISLYNI